MTLTPLCTNQIAVNQMAAEGHVAAIRCKRWSCPQCHEVNRLRVIQAAVDGKPKAMLTLTVSSKQYPSHEEATAALKHGLRLLRLTLRRHPKFENFEFMAVFEKHQSGFPHLHLLIRGKFLPWSWLTRRWKEITGSTHIDIRKIKGRKDAARYVAKYLGKDLSAFEGCKRWWRSHGYAPEPSNDNEAARPAKAWSRFIADFDRMALILENGGYTVTVEGRRRLHYAAPPDILWSPIELLWFDNLERQGHDWDYIAPLQPWETM